jgi:glycosyltransferase involved in cell wall biosynthesis
MLTGPINWDSIFNTYYCPSECLWTLQAVRYVYIKLESRFSMDKPRSHNVTIIAPTCFYYQGPLFRALAADNRIDLMVIFCTDEGVSGIDIASAYGTIESWGSEADLLEGYNSKFIRNHAPGGSYLKSLVGLFNLGIWQELNRTRPNAVVVMSWMNPTWWLTFLACLRFRIPILLMTDANADAEQLKSTWKSWLKRIFLGSFLFPSASGFLCAGTANKQLYALYGAPDRKLFDFAYSWGYASLIEKSKLLRNQKSELRTQYGLPQDAVIILYCGRLSTEKGVIELIDAYKLVLHPRKALVLVGDGRLRRQMQETANAHGIESIYFMGFRNREEIGKFYSLSDILVLPSRRETWGMVVNEGLCFSLPVVTSDQVGSGRDLVIHGENGYVFPAGDVSALAKGISRLIDLPDEDLLKMGEKSWSIINEWTNRDIVAAMVESLELVGPESNGRVVTLLLTFFRGLPSSIAFSLVFSIVGFMWFFGFSFLLFRPFLRRIRNMLKRVGRNLKSA